MMKSACCAMAGIMLMFLTTSSVASRVKIHDLLQAAEDMPPQSNANPPPPGVRFLDYLIARQSPKNPLCANVRVPKVQKGSRKRKVDETEARECGADGFLMTMNVQHSLKLYFQRTLGTTAGNLAARAAMFAGNMRGTPAGWERFFQSEELLKLPGSEQLTRQQFEGRFQQLQEHRRSIVLSDPDSKLCVFDETGVIPVELFERSAKKKGKDPEMVKRDPTKVAPDEYVHELLSDSDYFYIHEEKPIIAFINIVTNPAEAERLGLPWADGWSSYAYVPLVCSAEKGGGTIAMQSILEFAIGQKIDRILLSALTHVAWLYYGKAGATFIDRDGQFVDVSEFADMEPRPDPISEKQAVSRRLMAPP